MEEWKKKEETKKEIARKMLKMGMNENDICIATGLFGNKLKALKSEGLSEEEKSIMLFDLKAENEELKERIDSLEDDIRRLKNNQ